MKGLILLANYFEDMEAIITIDLLRRAKIEIHLVSITGSKQLLTQSKIQIEADLLYEQVNLNEYDFLIIPGGKATFETNIHSQKIKQALTHFYNKKQLIACICAAPILLGLQGYLNDLPFVCFPSCETYIKGQYLPNEKVVVVNNLITSKAAGTTFEFSYEIIKYLLGETVAKQVLTNVYYKEE